MVDRSHEILELPVDDRDEHLGRIDVLQDLLADRLSLDTVAEILDDLEVDVG